MTDSLFDVANIVDLIGNYQLEDLNKAEGEPKIESPEVSHGRVASLLGADGLEALYKGCSQHEVTTCREAFVAALHKTFTENLQADKDTESGQIMLKDLLGEDSVILYKKAIEEERSSIAFRDAVLLQSTKNYKSIRKLEGGIVLWVAGPSSSGKSFATESVVKSLIVY